MREFLRAVELFSEMSEEDLARLESRSELVTLAKGEQLFAEGDDGDRAYIITDGELEIVKGTTDRDVLLAVRRPGEVIGEMALLQDAPRSATARAGSEVSLISIPKSEIDTLLDTSTQAVQALFKVLLDRWQATQALLAQSERMAQLGTLTAGLAHEMNNPAAAIQRAGGQLRDAVAELVTAERRLAESVDPEHREDLRNLREELAEARPEPMDALQRSDLEETVEEVLEAAGVPDAWRLASSIVEAGLADKASELAHEDPELAGNVLEAVRSERDVASLLHEVEEGSRRLSAIVGALKSYSYLDQGPVQEVDLEQGIDDTLLILKSKLADLEVRREYAEDLPSIEGYGSELNQVWTNLIDNAADAIHESDGTGGVVTVRAFPSGDSVVVEVEDDGPGIPADSIHRVFDSFYTTKPPGSGTGLGLDISHAIVVNKHGGEITVTSEPGRTVFRVTLPRRIRERTE